jgi:hypothetical protein
MTCQAQLRAPSPTNEKPQSSIAAKARERLDGRAGALLAGNSYRRRVSDERKGRKGRDLAARITLNLSFSTTALRKGASSGGCRVQGQETKVQRAAGRARGWTCKGFQGNGT